MIKDQIFINYRELFASISWPHPDQILAPLVVSYFSLMGMSFLYSQTVFEQCILLYYNSDITLTFLGMWRTTDQ